MRLASRAALAKAAAYASAVTMAGALHAAPVARSYSGARLEPRSQVLVGAGQVSVDDFVAFAGALHGQANPVIFMDYVDLHSTAIPAFFAELKGKLAAIPWYCVPQIGLGFDDDSGRPYDDRVASGAYDANIRLLAHCLKELGRPTFLRIGYEFHGTWNGYSPASYRAAFLRVVAALRSEGASQVATVWCAEAGSLPEDYLKYYPGDEAVDWWAIDLFDADHFSRPMLGRFMEDSRARRKPVMIGESTCRHVGTLDGAKAWGQWFEPYFAFIESNANVKAFCYINWDWAPWAKRYSTDWSDWGDCRIQRSELVAQRFLDRIRPALYLKATNECPAELSSRQ